MLVARWGNSLAVRIPADVARTLGLKEGDDVKIRRASDGALDVARDEDRERALAAIRSLRGTLPTGFKFDRDEANAR